MKSSHKYFSPAESWKMSVIFNLKLFQLTKKSMSQHNKIKHKYKLKKWQKIHCYIFPPILALNLVLNCKTYNFDEVFSPCVFFTFVQFYTNFLNVFPSSSIQLSVYQLLLCMIFVTSNGILWPLGWWDWGKDKKGGVKRKMISKKKIKCTVNISNHGVESKTEPQKRCFKLQWASQPACL